MNNLSRITSRFAGVISQNPQTLRNVFGKRDITRTLWHMSKIPESSGNRGTVFRMQQPTLNFSCGCGNMQQHTKCEETLVKFLTEEIISERNAQKVKGVPTKLDGFDIKIDGSDMEMTKIVGNEKLVISFNVNHTVDAEADPNVDPGELSEMRSRPQFEIEIVKGSTTLAFTCSFIEGGPQDGGEYQDVFGINEVSVFEGEWSDKVYAVAGDVLDPDLYQLFINLLDEKGINGDFAEKLCDVSTAYEHALYIGLLEGVSKFTTTK